MEKKLLNYFKRESEYREFSYLASKGCLVDDNLRHHTFKILKNENDRSLDAKTPNLPLP